MMPPLPPLVPPPPPVSKSKSTPLDLTAARVSGGRLYIPGLGDYSVRLSRGGKDVTEEMLTKNPAMVESLLRSTLAALQNTKISSENFGDHVRISREAKGLTVSNEETAFTAKVSENSILNDYKEKTQALCNLLLSGPNEVKVSFSRAKPNESQLSRKETEIWNDQALQGLLRKYWQSPKEKQELIKEVNQWLENRPVNEKVEQRDKYGELTIGDLLHFPGNEALRDVLIQIVEDKIPEEIRQKVHQINSEVKPLDLGKPGKKFKFRSELQFFILRHIKRIQRNIHQDDGKGGKVFSQTQVMMRGKGELLSQKLASGKFSSSDLQSCVEENYGWSSEFDKTTPEDVKGHCTNFGVVKTVNHKGESYISCARSGKTHDINRVKENVFLTCLASLATDKRVGFTTNKDGKLEYQQMIVSLMDRSFLKSFQGKENNEKALLKSMQEAIDAWQPSTGIEVEVPDPAKPGKTLQIILKKPIFCNQMFAWLLKDQKAAKFFSIPKRERSIEKTNEANKAANQQLFILCLDRFFPKVDKKPLATEKEQIDFLENMLRDNSDPKLEKIIESLYALMTRQSPGKKQPVHAAEMQMCRKILCNALNIVMELQCKSGVDRTGIGVSLAASQDQFRECTDFDTDPFSDSNSKETEIFRTHFNGSLKGVALPVTVESKGEWGIAWSRGAHVGVKIGNPVPFKYLNKELVRHKDSKAHPYHSTNLYSYKFHDKEAERVILGASENEFRKARDKFSEKNKEKMKEVQEILESSLGLKVNGGLNLHQSMASLTEEQVKEMRETVAALKSDQAGSEKIFRGMTRAWTPELQIAAAKAIQEFAKKKNKSYLELGLDLGVEMNSSGEFQLKEGALFDSPAKIEAFWDLLQKKKIGSGKELIGKEAYAVLEKMKASFEEGKIKETKDLLCNALENILYVYDKRKLVVDRGPDVSLFGSYFIKSP